MTDWRTTDIVGTLRFIGWNPSRERSLETASQSNIDLVFGGMAGETHGGHTRAACVRVKNLFDPGTEIFNSRQLSVLSTEELDQIAQDMGVPSLNPEWVGANLVIEGMDHLSLLPPSARLQFDSGATIVVSAMNKPCKYPAEVIATHYPDQGKFFVKAALNRRGFTAFVEREGPISVGMGVRLFVPDQPKHPTL